MHIQIVNRSSHPLPQRATPGASGLDIRAWLQEDVTIAPLQRTLVNTGISLCLPEGFEGQVRPRSGLATRCGITVLNAPGTIDADYRGEIRVLLINLSSDAYTLRDGDRIAQLVIASYIPDVVWRLVEELPTSQRNRDGFGSTGIA